MCLLLEIVWVVCVEVVFGFVVVVKLNFVDF